MSRVYDYYTVGGHSWVVKFNFIYLLICEYCKILFTTLNPEIFCVYYFCLGYEVDYVGDFPDLPAGNIVVRVLLLLWTGDYPAQCEVGKFIKGGILACRRDKVKGEMFKIR